MLEASFRGRLLRGVTHELPSGYGGVVLEEERSGGWRVTSSFSRLQAWKHDNTPGSADADARLMQWLKLAAVLAAPISTEEVSASVSAYQACND